MIAIAKRALLLAASLALLGPALAALPAQATVAYLSSFGGNGTGRGQFLIPGGVAINDTTGDVYVTDPKLNRVQEFDPDGNFIRMWGSGVDQTTGGDLCPANPGDPCGPGAAASGPGGFNSPLGIAVDNSPGSPGDVYVIDAVNNRIERFTASGQFILTWGKGVNQTTGGDLCPVAPGDVCAFGGTSGDRSAAPPIPSEPGEFSGFNLSNFRFAFGPAIAVDGAGAVYVGDPLAVPNPRVEKFDSQGAFLGQIASPLNEISHSRATRAPGPAGRLVADAAGDVFVDNELKELQVIKRFTPSQFSADGLSAAYDLTYTAFAEFGDSAKNLAIDPYNQNLFTIGSDCQLAHGSRGQIHLLEYDTATGEEVDCTGPSDLPVGNLSGTSVSGIAISAAHRLYIADPSNGQIRIFQTPVAAAPAVGDQSISKITATKAVIGAQVTGNLAETTYHVEYGSQGPCSSNPCQSTPESAGVTAAAAPSAISRDLTGLLPQTIYYYRVVATNQEGSTSAPDRSFTTYPEAAFDSTCPNNLARQQTGAALLLDCRAYELVSAPDTGGYNVESDLVAGETPLPGYPQASGRALYAVHNGVVPDSGGKPTNRGLDPYLATRDAANGRWDTTYVGVPADAPSAVPFSSTLLAADAGLDTFAFGGPGICSPCFGDGSSGIPLRLPGGGLVQGMVGAAGSPLPSPVPAGTVKVPVSADGSHFLFGSTQQFAPGGNSDGTDATIYSRDLGAATTQVVSTDPAGGAIVNGEGLAELNVSSDGQRVLIGEKLGTDSAGAPLYHLYMHVGSNPDSIDLTPGTTSGVSYAGMDSGGSIVYFTTRDALVTAADQDTDTSTDLYRADVDAAATGATLTPVSVGASGSGDTDSCAPLADSQSSHWNALPGAPTDCSVLAIGGGGGVASGSGDVYFLSPENLTELPTCGVPCAAREPIQDAPNLYVARPGQAPPSFVATLESAIDGPQPPPTVLRLDHNFGSFSKATGVAVDRSGATHYLYVLDLGNGANNGVKKFDLSGSPVSFSAGSGAGTNHLDGSEAPSGTFSPQGISGVPASLAVDQSSGDFYVPDYNHNVVDAFISTGAYDRQISVGSPAGVAVDPVNGNVYVVSKDSSAVKVFSSADAPVASFSVSAHSPNPTGVAVDSSGAFYVVNGTQTAVYDASGGFVKVLDPNPSTGVAVDPSSHDVYIDEGSRFVQFDSVGAGAGGSDGEGAAVGVGALSGSVGIAPDAGAVFASNGHSVAVSGPVLKPTPFIDNPLVIDALAEPGIRRTADFQVDPSGEQAVFASTMALTGVDSAGHSEVFRYDRPGGTLACVSCSTIGQLPTSDASLASNGLSLTDDGRVFFNSGEPLVLRDTNAKQDAYEWGDGKVELISSGQSSFDSGLLTVGADGTDALFFTREALTSNDHNGSLMGLYDARHDGGFFVIPPPPGCAASDECHGPGSPSPEAPVISTLAGTGGQVLSPKPCKHGLVRRGSRCVPRHPHPHHRARRRKG